MPSLWTRLRKKCKARDEVSTAALHPSSRPAAKLELHSITPLLEALPKAHEASEPLRDYSSMPVVDKGDSSLPTDDLPTAKLRNSNSSCWPAHRAAFFNEHRELKALTQAWTVEDWTSEMDACGNTVLHVAALRHSLECLSYILEVGCPVSTLNAAGWTAFDECQSADASAGKTAMRRLFDALDAPNRAASAEGSARISRMQEVRALLTSMPDFKMEVRWKFGSPLFGMLVRQVAPSDTYVIWKVGDRLRMDATLVGMHANKIDRSSRSCDHEDTGDERHGSRPSSSSGASSLSSASSWWKRGHASLLLAPLPVVPASQQRQASLAPDAYAHSDSSARPAAPAAVAPASTSPPSEMSVVILNHQKQSAYLPQRKKTATETDLTTPRVVLGLSVPRSASAGRANPDGQMGAAARENMRQSGHHDKRQGPFISSGGWFTLSELEAQASRNTPTSAGSGKHASAMEDIASAACSRTTSGVSTTSATDMNRPTEASAAPVPVPVVRVKFSVISATEHRARLAADRRFMEHCICGRDAREKVETVGAQLRECHDWLGRPLIERVGGVIAQAWDASTRLRTSTPRKINWHVVRGSFDDYLANAANSRRRDLVVEAVTLPVTWDGTLKSAGLRHEAQDEAGTLLRARVWLAPHFALTRAHFELVLDLMARMGQDYARRFRDALGGMDLGLAFPVKVHLPLPLTIWGQIACTHFEHLDADAAARLAGSSWFDVPEDYERRATNPLELASEVEDFGGLY